MSDGQSRLSLSKYHILGNSYVILPPGPNPAIGRWLRPDQVGDGIERALEPSLVRRICSIDYGIGSSGVVFGPLGDQDGAFALHIYNEDGSRCNFSGNAIRMLARYLVESGAVAGTIGTRIRLNVIGRAETDGRPTSVTSTAEVEIAAEGGGEIRAYLPPPVICRESVAAGPQAIREAARPAGAPTGPDVWLTVPALDQLGSRFRRPGAWDSSALVNVGNPHCITFVESLRDLPTEDFADIDRASLTALSYAGRDVRAQPLGDVFPDGCNLQFAYVEPDGRRLHLRTFERGGGPTKSSGSSSSATAAAAFARGLVGPEVTVAMVGGDMTIRLAGSPDRVSGIGLGSAVTRIGAMDMTVGPSPQA